MTGERGEELVITEAEWQAVLLGARALSEVGAWLRSGGAYELARECDRNAAELEGLARRATIAAHREAGAEMEAER
jgi:hypothetical protein